MAHRTVEEKFYRAASDVLSLFKEREAQYEVDLNYLREGIEDRDQKIDVLEERLGDRSREVVQLKKEASSVDLEELRKKIVEQQRALDKQKEDEAELKRAFDEQKRAFEDLKREFDEHERACDKHKKALSDAEFELRIVKESNASYKRIIEIANAPCSPIPPLSFPSFHPNLTQPEVSVILSSLNSLHDFVLPVSAVCIVYSTHLNYFFEQERKENAAMPKGEEKAAMPKCQENAALQQHSEEEIETQPLSEFPRFLGPVTSTQVDAEAVIPDTEDQLEYRARYEPDIKYRKVDCSNCKKVYQLNALDPYCPHCGER
jgi:DNA repair exonuclease SbcCD ATPase subunit